MKLATLNNGSRDGQLVLVNRELSQAVTIAGVPTLQYALDHWLQLEPELRQRDRDLQLGKVRNPLSFNPQDCLAPLPRAYQWADGSAYVNHVELVRKARGASMPQSFWTDPLMYQGGSDHLLGPTAPIRLADPAWGCDLEAEIAVITDDVAAGVSPDQAAESIRLLVLVNDVSLRHLIPEELAKGFGFFQSKPASALSPCALTPDEFGPQWDGRRLHGRLQVSVRDQLIGLPDTGVDMVFDFTQLIAHAARTRRLGAGSIIGGGTVSNRDADGGPGKPLNEGGRGYACLAEQRTVEQLRHGAITSPFLQWGDRVRIEMLDSEGHSLFGAIEQFVMPA